MNRLKIPKRVPECGRKSLLTWVNSKLRTNFYDINNLSNGAAYCRLINLIHPGIIAGKKIKLDPSPSGCLPNYKLLQNAFYVLKVDKVIPVEQLIACSQRALLTFTCWIKIFFEINVSLYSDVSNVSSNNPQNNSGDVKKVAEASVTSDLQSRPEFAKKTKKLESVMGDFSSNEPSIDYFLYQISEDNPPKGSEQVRNQITHLFQDEEEEELKLESISNVSLREFEALEAMLESSHCTEYPTNSTSYKLDPQKGPSSKMFQKEFPFDEAFNQWFEKELNVKGGGENDVIDKNNERQIAYRNHIPPIKLFAEPSINSQTYIQDSDTTKYHHNERSLQYNAIPDFQTNLQQLLEFQRSSPSKFSQHHFTDTEPLASATAEPDVHYSTSSSSNTTNMKIDRSDGTLREGFSSSPTKSFFQPRRSSPPSIEELHQNNNFSGKEFHETLNCAVLVATGIHEDCKLSDNNDYDEHLTECISDEKKYNLLKLEEENEKTLIF
ncbi:uncharacterized protein LOC118762151 [Octopus sinensis]|uniref:Uncharacterized protein LOC118762151 n=1 Tax=Octopus sinensis TaxID=2607531 RepID=A0A7E6EMB7_9MOLL|nr:uncharacterized protein LOC118762151 [Octopus sinensis]